MTAWARPKPADHTVETVADRALYSRRTGTGRLLFVDARGAMGGLHGIVRSPTNGD